MVKSDNINAQKLAEILEICSQQALQAGKAIPQILSLLSKEDDGLGREHVDINQLISATIKFVNAQKSHNVNIKEQLAVNLPLVTVNRLHIEKVLINLLQNSLDALPELVNECQAIEVSTCLCPKNSDRVQVTVCDFGPGLTNSETLEKIFTAFFTTKPSGLGMGLAVSRALVVAQGGEIWATQNPTTGISVSFTLPIYS